MKPLSYEEYQQKLKSLITMSDVTNFAKELIAPTLQTMLEAEMDQHLGYQKHNPKGKNSGNSRNGHSAKTLKTSFGEAEMEIPRDRNGDFEPVAVPKYQTVQSDVEQKIIAMYAKGMTTRDIQGYMNDIYGVDVSPTMISSITDKVMPQVKEWQVRPLSDLYTILYLDGVHFKVREDGRIMVRCAYVMLGINGQGIKEILGIWIGENEGAKFWMQILNEIKNRGVEDVLICCVDGLSGFKDAISAIFPGAQIQQCIVHQIRNSVKYVPHKDKKKFCEDLRNIYTAPTEEAGFIALEAVEQKWPQYALYLKSWRDKWPELSAFYGYPQQIRRIIYTTNAIENLNRQFRKVTKTTTIFPHHDALLKLLWLAQNDISKKWTMTVRNWGEIVNQLSILFPDKKLI